MTSRNWCVAAAAMLSCAHAQAADKGEWQFSGLIGQGRLHVDGDRMLGGLEQKEDTTLLGIGVGYKLPAGALLELGYTFNEHSFLGKDEDFILKQFSASVGWQFDSATGWRFKPRVGVAELKLHNDARLLLDDDGGRHMWQSSLAPFAEVAVLHRVGPHFAMGANYREVFPDFGHYRAWGLVMTLNF